MARIAIYGFLLLLAALFSVHGSARAEQYGTITDIDGAKLEAYGLTDGQSCLRHLSETPVSGIEAALYENGCKAKYGPTARIIHGTAKLCGTYVQPQKYLGRDGLGYVCSTAVCGRCAY